MSNSASAARTRLLKDLRARALPTLSGSPPPCSCPAARAAKGPPTVAVAAITAAALLTWPRKVRRFDPLEVFAGMAAVERVSSQTGRVLALILGPPDLLFLPSVHIRNWELP